MKNHIDAITSINQLLDEVRGALLLAGVMEECIRIKKGKHRIDACNRAFDWLHNLKISWEFQNLIKTRTLLPEKTWKRYELFGITDLKEQILLNQAKRKLLSKWCKKRPAMFKGQK